MITTATLSILHDKSVADELRAILAQLATTLESSPNSVSVELEVTQK